MERESFIGRALRFVVFVPILLLLRLISGDDIGGPD